MSLRFFVLGCPSLHSAQPYRLNRCLVAVLDEADFVERYSWMSAHDGSGRRGLIEDGPDGNVRLTELGHIWNSDA